MKTIQYAVVAAMVMSLLANVPVFAADVSDVIADHQATAASYEQKAAQQDVVIAEHTQMKKDYERRYYINEKVTPKSGIFGKMDKHCDAIIKDAQKLKEDYLEFAKWHKMQAAELKGQ